jgi:hypothetical protein
MLVRRAFGFAFAATIVIACSGGTAGSGGGQSSSSFVTDYCNIYAPCCAKAGKRTDGQVCAAFFNAFTSGENYDPVKGQQCLDAARAASNNPDFCDKGFDDTVCNGVYTKPGGGNAQPGAACTTDSDCAADPGGGKVDCYTDFDSKGGETKTCQVQLVGKAGDTPCLGTKDGNLTSYAFSSDNTPPPAKGYICDVSNKVYCDSTSKACKAIAEVGEDCSSGASSYACVKTAYCDFSTKKCVARIAVGGDCTANSQACADKSYCDQTSKKCTAQLGAGAPCESSQQCESSSCVNKACGSGGTDLGTVLLCGN